MQIQTILDHIERKVQDSSYDRDSDLLDFVNIGLGEIASEVVLPGLLTYGTITCADNVFVVDLPDDYYSHLIHVHNTTKDSRVTIYKNLTIFLEKFSGLNTNGDVIAACVHGSNLYYYETPGSDQTLRIWYSTFPTLFTDDNDTEITYIPTHLQGPLLINYGAMKVFEEIEDEADMPNFNKYFNLYSKAKAALIDFVGLPEEPPEFVPKNRIDLNWE